MNSVDCVLHNGFEVVVCTFIYVSRNTEEFESVFLAKIGAQFHTFIISIFCTLENMYSIFDLCGTDSQQITLEHDFTSETPNWQEQNFDADHVLIINLLHNISNIYLCGGDILGIISDLASTLTITLLCLHEE